MDCRQPFNRRYYDHLRQTTISLVLRDIEALSTKSADMRNLNAEKRQTMLLEASFTLGKDEVILRWPVSSPDLSVATDTVG